MFRQTQFQYFRLTTRYAYRLDMTVTGDSQHSFSFTAQTTFTKGQGVEVKAKAKQAKPRPVVFKAKATITTQDYGCSEVQFQPQIPKIGYFNPKLLYQKNFQQNKI